MQIAKAQPTGDQEILGCSIHFSFECPRHESIEAAENFFQGQAKDLEEALFSTLPGGTYDRLLGLMLKRKSTHFVVSHKS